MYLVLDQGGQSSRAAVFAENGELLQLCQQPVSTHTPKTVWVEQNPSEIIQSLRHCLAQINDASAIKSAALVTQRSSIVCWRRDTGEALKPVISWQDTRGADILSELKLCPEKVRQRTGLFPNSHFGASKIPWCLRHVPEVATALGEGQLRVGPISSYLLQQLTEERLFLADAGNAQRTLLYNINKHQWDEHLLELFEVPQEILPNFNVNEEWGHLKIAGQRVPVRLVSGDQNCAFIALGQGCPRTAVINAGTGAFIGIPSNNPANIPQRLLQTILPDGGFVAEGTVNGAGRALAIMAAQLGCDVESITALGESAPLFLNGEGGLAAPYWRADFASRFVGQGTNTEKLAAVQESIVFLLYRCFLEAENMGGLVEQIKVAGGMSQSELFCQSIANLFQQPVIRPQIIEATAAGAAMVLAGGRSWPVSGKRFEPESSAVIGQRFSKWQSAMEAALSG